MNTLPATLHNQLVVLDDTSFEQQSLQWQVRRLSDEAQHEQQLLEGARDKLRLIAMFMAYHNKHLMVQLDDLIAELRMLQGLPPVQRYEPTSPEDILNHTNTPQEPEGKKRAVGWVEKACKDTFRKISSLCHPDRTRDQNLRDFMPFANEFYEQRDLECLQMILTEVESYSKAKKKRGTMEKLFRAKLRDLRNRLTSFKAQREHILTTRNWQMVVAYEQGNTAEAKTIHEELTWEQIADVRMQIAQIKGARRFASGDHLKVNPAPMPDDFLKRFTGSV